jgi:transposase-like protein
VFFSAKFLVIGALLCGAGAAFGQSIWTARYTMPTNRTLRAAVWTGTQVVAVGDSGATLISPDGITWTSYPTTAPAFAGITWSGSQYVAVGGAPGEAFIYTSPDAITWTKRTNPANGPLFSVTWNGSLFVAVGVDAINDGTPRSRIFTSSDAITWTGRSASGGEGLEAVIWGGTQFVAVGDGGRGFVSSDGLTWSNSNPPVDWLFGVAWSGSLFAAVGSGGIVTSSNGTSWTSRSSLSGKCVVWTGTQFVSGAYASTNGLAWGKPGTTSPAMQAIVWTGTTLVAVGSQISTALQDTTVPQAPALRAPASNATGVVITSPTLSWTKSPFASSYRVQLSTTPDFASFVVNDSNVADTSRTAGTLTASTTYYWRVNAKNVAGTSSFSAMGTFTTAIAPPASAPTQLAPSNSFSGLPLPAVFLWRKAAGATSYRLQISRQSGFTTLDLDDSTLTDTTRSVSGLLASTLHYWRLRAQNAGGASAYNASAWTFTTSVAAPATPVLAAPSANATGVSLSPTLSWNTATGALTYRIQLASDSAFASLLVNDSTVTGTSRAVGPLTNNTLYYWRVNAKNAGGTSAYSTMRKFTTVPITALMPGDVSLRTMPFANGLSLRFDLPKRERVVIRMFDTRGHETARLLDETRESGRHILSLPAGMPDALYVLDFRAGDFHETLKILP